MLVSRLIYVYTQQINTIQSVKIKENDATKRGRQEMTLSRDDAIRKDCNPELKPS